MTEGGRKSDGATALAVGATVPGVGTDLSPGTAVGEYRIERVVGRGGMGVVYAAIQPVIEKKVAIKVLAAQFSATPDLVRRFVDEARAVNRIGHENIIDIFSFGQLPDGRQYFVMEFLEGGTLGERIERGDLAADQLPVLLAQICDALEAAHAKKIIHRDLKPENIWVGTSLRGQPRVRLLDFGIAKLLDTGDRMVTDVGAVMGTPQFMSPEQCNGRGVDHRSDIYAMGVIMYRLFGGRFPFTGETYAEILGKQITQMPPAPATLARMPAALDRLIMRCLDKDPAGRPDSAAALGAALAAVFSAPPDSARSGAGASPHAATTPALGMQSTEVQPAAAGPAAPRSSRRWIVLAVAAGGLALVAAVIAARGRTSPPATTVVSPAAPPFPASASPAQPARPAPAAEPVAPPPAPPPAQPAVVNRPASKRRAAGEPNADQPAPAKPIGSSRASRTGLVTDNPFE